MSSIPQTSASGPATPPPTGHPPGLYMLFFAEMWERFCFYGMRALLKLYMIQTVILASVEPGKREGTASLVYGSYLALVYGSAIVGGMVADRILGARRAIITGGIIMAVGEFMLLIPTEQFFYMGLATVVVGNGMFKPNISAIVGKLYQDGDPRRDGGFTIFYMGINLGAFLSPLICGWVGETYGHRYGFALAGLGMLLGIGTFWRGLHVLGEHGLPPAGRTHPARDLWTVVGGAIVCVPIGTLLLQQDRLLAIAMTGAFVFLLFHLLRIGFRGDAIQRDRMIALAALLLINVAFWACFEQAGNSFTSYTKTNVDRGLLGWQVPVSWFQSFNAIFIIALAPVFALMWTRLAKSDRNPQAPAKFALGVIGVALGLGLLVLGTKMSPGAGLVSMWFMVGCYFVHTVAELCISPVGLSWMTKLAPKDSSGLVLGAWFLSTGVGNYISGWISELTGEVGATEDRVKSLEIYTTVFGQVFWIVTVFGVLLLFAAPMLNRRIHGIK